METFEILCAVGFGIMGVSIGYYCYRQNKKPAMKQSLSNDNLFQSDLTIAVEER